jgi:hypothetical protein
MVKSTRKVRISTGNRSQLFRSHRRNLNVARRRGMASSTVKSMAARVRNFTRNAKNKTKEAQTARVKMANIVVKLRVMNNQLKLALEIYNDRVEDEQEGPLIDAVSMFLDSIKSNVEDREDEFEGFVPDDDIGVYEYVDEFTEYIDDDIISGYKKAALADISNRVKESEVILKMLISAIESNARDLNEGIAADRSDRLAVAVNNMMDGIERMNNGNL